jgi:hypothetical protein
MPLEFGIRPPDAISLDGWPWYPGGVIAGPEIDETLSTATLSRLDYQYITPYTNALPLDLRAIIVNVNGKYETTEDGDGVLHLAPSSHASDYRHLTMFPMQRDSVGNATWEDATYLWTRQVANKVLVEWADIPTDADFASYELYWDEGNGTPANTLLASISRRHERQYLTAALNAGTYLFRLEYKDDLGNESTGATEYSHTVYATPTIPGHSNTSFSAANRTLTLTFDTSDEIYIYANYITATQQSDYVFWDVPFGIKRSGGATYTTRRLWDGFWRFAFCRVSDQGIEGPCVYYFTRLVELAGTFTQIVNYGGPTKLWVSQASGAVITASWDWKGDQPANTFTELWVNDDGAGYSLEATVASTVETANYTSTAGNTCLVKVRAKSTTGGTDYGPFTDAISITADGTAPSGDNVLTTRSVF